MVVRAGFLILALVSAVRVCQINISRRSRKASTSGDDDEKASSQQEGIEKKDGKFGESKVELEKQVNLPEVSAQDEEGKSGIDLLKNAVKLKEKESWNREVRLIELCCLKEQESRIAALRKQLKDKISEIGVLNATIDKLKAEKEQLYEEVKVNQLAKKQIESAEVTILELQARRGVGADQMEGQLMQLKEQVLGICRQDKHHVHGHNNKVERKLTAVRELELKAIKIKRRNIELQLDKRELMVKLNAAQAQMAELSSLTEHERVAKFEEEISRLKQANSNLSQEVDNLHKDRFSFLEEMVYQRWLNKCLKFELEDHRRAEPKKINSNKFHFRSHSNSSDLSSFDGSDELTNSTSTSSSSTDHSTKKKRLGLIHSIKRWARRKEDNLKSPEGKPGLIRGFSTSSIPSSILGLRNQSGGLFPSKNNEAMDSSSPEKPAGRRARRVSFNDSINSVRYIYDERPQWDQGTSENSQKISENSNHSSGINSCSDSETAMEEDGLPSLAAEGETLEGKMASSTFSLQNQECARELNPQKVVQGRQRRHQADSGSSGRMWEGASGSRVSMFCELAVNLIVGALTLTFFLLLIYFRLISAFI